jgi:hypothetical protein
VAKPAPERFSSALAQFSKTLSTATQAGGHLTPDERRQVCALILTIGAVLGEEIVT